MRVFLVLLSFVVCFAVSDELVAKLATRQTQVASLAAAASDMLSASTTSTSDCQWNDGCQWDPFPLASTCDARFGLDSRCECTSAKVDLTHSLTLKAPDSVLGEDMDKELCSTLDLDTNFMDLWDQDDTLRWQYVGFNSGFFRRFPFVSKARSQVNSSCEENCCMEPSSSCASYDPRVRPWYSTASSGPKNVILVLDVSGSMRTDDRISSAISAASAVVQTLSYNDFVNVVTFSDRAQLIDTDYTGLVRATSETKEHFINRISLMSPGGTTNFGAAFRSAFEVLKTAISDGDVAGCSTALLFMTDGKQSDTVDTKSLIESELAELSSDIVSRLSIHTFSLSSSADTVVPKNLACAFDGIWTPIVDSSDDLIYKMSTFYQYFAMGMNFNSPAWSEKYVDASGLGEMTTVALPLYNADTDFVGVAGLDLLWGDLFLGNDTEEEIIEELRSRSNRCPDFTATVCDIERLRGEDGYCGLCDGLYPSSDSSVSTIIIVLCVAIVAVAVYLLVFSKKKKSTPHLPQWRTNPTPVTLPAQWIEPQPRAPAAPIYGHPSAAGPSVPVYTPTF